MRDNGDQVMLTLTDTKNGLRQGKKLLISHFMSEILFVMSLSQKHSIVKSVYILICHEKGKEHSMDYVWISWF